MNKRTFVVLAVLVAIGYSVMGSLAAAATKSVASAQTARLAQIQ